MRPLVGSCLPVGEA